MVKEEVGNPLPFETLEARVVREAYNEDMKKAAGEDVRQQGSSEEEGMCVEFPTPGACPRGRRVHADICCYPRPPVRCPARFQPF